MCFVAIEGTDIIVMQRKRVLVKVYISIVKYICTVQSYCFNNLFVLLVLTHQLLYCLVLVEQ